MAARGRRSAASFAVGSVVNVGSKADVAPAEELSEAEVAVWVDVIAAMPKGWIRPENVEQLAAYARHSVSARDLSKLIADFKPDWLGEPGGLERYDRLLKMRDRESRPALIAARSLRITVQSVDPKTAGRKGEAGDLAG